ncbi:hypothetical protein KBD49_00625 [Myxococcota bacterium]|jgi:hypothetical protein|nr:hypothetical protein [Myxococcota bacterium]
MKRLAFLLLVLPGIARADGEAPGTWTIQPGQVGPVRVGQPLPRSLREPEAGGEYFVGYVSDGQPVEGLEWKDPPIRVRMRSGPFTRKAARAYVAPDATPCRARALREIRKGTRVLEVAVTGPGPATSEGHGVGSTLADLRRSWPDLSPHPVPPTRGQDECVANPPSLPGVWFFFRSCREAEAGDPVIRVDVRDPRPRRR